MPIRFAKKLDSDMKIALEKRAKYKNKTKVLIIHYGQASNVYLVMTQKSVGAKMVEWAGGELAIKDEKGMKQISPELVAASDPDVILLTDFGYDRLGGSFEKIKELPGVSSTKAFKNKRIYRIEEHDFFRYINFKKRFSSLFFTFKIILRMLIGFISSFLQLKMAPFIVDNLNVLCSNTNFNYFPCLIRI